MPIHCYFCQHFLRVERFIHLWGFLHLAVIVWLGSSCSMKETSLCTCSASSLLSQLLTEQVKARHTILCTFFPLGKLSQVESKKGTSEELIILTGVSLKLVFYGIVVFETRQFLGTKTWTLCIFLFIGSQVLLSRYVLHYYLFLIVFFFFFIRDRGFVCSLGWGQNCSDPPAPVSWTLGLQGWATHHNWLIPYYLAFTSFFRCFIKVVSR